MKILVTVFAPFGGETINPSYEALRVLPDTIEGCEIIKYEMPVSYDVCPSLLEWMIIRYSPDAVVCFGQAGGRTAITPEYVSINLKHSTIPDNSGIRFTDCPVIEGAPAAYFTKLPVRQMVCDLQKAGLPGFVSYSAGTFVCNCLCYHLMHMIEVKFPHMKGGFIHVPYTTQQAATKADGTASMDENTIAKGLEYAILALCQNKEDSGNFMGTTH